jgi:hypothetical protein
MLVSVSATGHGQRGRRRTATPPSRPLGVHLIAPVDRHSLLAITVLPKRPFLPKGGSTRTLTPGSGILLAAGEPHTETQDGQNAVPSERSSHDHHPGDFEALRRMPGALLALLPLYGLGIGAIIRHNAGAIATFVQSSQRLGAVLRDAAGSPLSGGVGSPVRRAVQRHLPPTEGRPHHCRRFHRRSSAGPAVSMTVEQAEDSETRPRSGGSGVALVVSQEQVAAAKALVRRILREPFTKRSLAELAFYLVSGGLAVIGLGFVGLTMVTGLVLAITFFGLAVLALSIRSARGFGGWIRALFRSMLGERIEDPDPFAARPGFLGWLQSTLRDRVGWRAVGYLAVKVPWTLLGFYLAFSLWWDALACVTRVFLSGGSGGGPGVFGLERNLFAPGYFSNGGGGLPHAVVILACGAIFLLAAPWSMRAFVNVDGMLIRGLLGPDPMAARVHSLEQARSKTMDASAATLRRIERDLHDGTQAQLVVLAMRLGMVKEKLGDVDHMDLDQVRGRHRYPDAADLHRRGSPPRPRLARPSPGPGDPALLPVHRDPLRR